MKRHYHLIGIGGIGMSALARILLKRGDRVSGSDISYSSNLRALEKEGATIYIGHDKAHVQNPHAIVFSSDIPKDNPEYQYALEEKIPLLHRSQLLAQMMEGYTPLLVTGTHGKTTTTSLLIQILKQADLDPSYAVGGLIEDLEVNGYCGKGMYFAAEADESDGSFINYPSFGGIITNLEKDHMQFWKTEAALKEAFQTFARRVGSREHLFWCRDDQRLASLALPGYSYGFTEEADLQINNFQQKGWMMLFDLTFQRKHYRNIEISLIGAHNVLNAAGVFGLGLKLDIKEVKMREAFKNFKGIKRRVERKGAVGDIEIYDDYAHHPTEIFSTLHALKKAEGHRRLVVVFQPHRFSRTKECLDDFADAFDFADVVVLTEIFAAREKPIRGITSEHILKEIKKKGITSYFVKRKELIGFLIDYLKPKDLLITMGAGDITLVNQGVLEGLKRK